MPDAHTIRRLAKGRAYVTIEGFCGPGGMSLGLHQSGFDVRLAFDIDAFAVQTHQRNLGNLGNRCIVADAADLTGGDLLAKAAIQDGKIDLFAGGPPCQGFSKQKRGAHLGDDRNTMVLHYVRFVEELRPRYFLFENVAIFGQKRGRQYIDEMAERLVDYKLFPGFYNSADFGLAQTRERFVMVGQRRDQKSSFQLPRPLIKKRTTVGEALAGLPEPPLDYTDHPAFANHQRARVTPINIERFSYVPQGGGWQDIPFELRLPCHKVANPTTGGWPDVYGRLEWDGQCPTITGGFDSFTRGRYGHPLHDRPLTPREAARLQGFPDDYVFVGTRGDVRSQIGNAVPPPLAHAFGLELLRSMLVHDGYLPDDAIGTAGAIERGRSSRVMGRQATLF